MRKRGFTIAELLVAMGVFAVVTAILSVAYQAWQNYKKNEITREKVKAIEAAIKLAFMDNARTAQGCYSWSDGICASLTLTPVKVSDTQLQFNTLSGDVLNILKRFGCQINGNLPNIVVSCPDGFGRDMTFETENEHQFGLTYSAPYTGNYFKLVIHDSVGQTFEISLEDLEKRYVELSKNKLYTIANAIKQYIRTKRELELANVCDDPGQGQYDPAGGLGSWDDALIPWIWEAVSTDGQNSLTLCSGVEDTNSKCGCQNFSDTSIWSNDQNLCILDTGEELQRFLRNINLDVSYWSDAFGNPITVVPLADADGTPIADCPPPRPQPNYPRVNLYKTRVGIQDSTENWVYFIDVVNE